MKCVVDVVVGAELGTHGVRAAPRFTVSGSENVRPGEQVLVVQDLPADDFVDPRLVDRQRPQLVGDLDRVAAGAEIGR